METLAEMAWRARWQAVRPNAIYNHDFGLERAWRNNADAWGYPLTDAEEPVQYAGQEAPARVFSRVGLVVWLRESGAKVVGWPG